MTSNTKKLVVMAVKVSPEYRERLRLIAREHRFTTVSSLLRVVIGSALECPNLRDSGALHAELADTASRLILLSDSLLAAELRNQIERDHQLSQLAKEGKNATATVSESDQTPTSTTSTITLDQTAENPNKETEVSV